jgi:phosphonate transport system substrate-binding protein
MAGARYGKREKRRGRSAGGRVRALLFLLVLVAAGCGREAPLGSAGRPIRMAFVPSVDASELTQTGNELARMIRERAGLHVKVHVGSSYAAVVAGMGAGTLDVGWLNPLSYVQAHDRSGVRVLLTTERDGATSYRGHIIARRGGPVRRIEDLKGKRFAFVDSYSTSGTLYPKLLMRAHGIDPDHDLARAFYAGGHDKVIIAVYNGQADAGAIYGGETSDARERVVKTLPDVMEKTVVIARTDPIPNDTVSVRKGFPPELAEKVKQALLAIVGSDEGRRTIFELYGINGLQPATDAEYDSVRRALQAANLDLETLPEQ